MSAEKCLFERQCHGQQQLDVSSSLSIGMTRFSGRNLDPMCRLVISAAISPMSRRAKLRGDAMRGGRFSLGSLTIGLNWPRFKLGWLSTARSSLTPDWQPHRSITIRYCSIHVHGSAWCALRCRTLMKRTTMRQVRQFSLCCNAIVDSIDSFSCCQLGERTRRADGGCRRQRRRTGWRC